MTPAPPPPATPAVPPPPTSTHPLIRLASGKTEKEKKINRGNIPMKQNKQYVWSFVVEKYRKEKKEVSAARCKKKSGLGDESPNLCDHHLPLSPPPRLAGLYLRERGKGRRRRRQRRRESANREALRRREKSRAGRTREEEGGRITRARVQKTWLLSEILLFCCCCCFSCIYLLCFSC